jgi:hypothetical protein
MKTRIEIFRWGWRSRYVRLAFCVGALLLTLAILGAIFIYPPLFMFMTGFVSACLICLYYMIEDTYTRVIARAVARHE